MAESNFRIFSESVASTDIMSDSEYGAATQRVSGVSPGIAEPALHNKLYLQATIMAAAIAQVVVQAGMDAKDDDYSGLVKNLRKTFAGSVNGILPDETGNIDLSALVKKLKEFATPDIGDLKITKNPENPSKKYPGTTWELLKEETFLMSAGGKVSAGDTGGNNSHSNTIDEMVPHSHAVTIGAAGGHTPKITIKKAGLHVHGVTVGSAGSHNHNRGSMNIWGSLCLPTHTGRWDRWIRGAFTTEGGNNNSKGVEGADFSESWRWHDITYCEFNANRNWTGVTNTVADHVHKVVISEDGEHEHEATAEAIANHTHPVSISDSGEGKAYDIRPKYFAVYMWIRTA